MKKRLPFLTLCVLFTLLFIAEAGAQYDINFSNFPSDTAYRKQVEEFMSYYKYVASWNPEWNASVPKAKVVSLMESLIKQTDAIMAAGKTANIDLQLFKVLLKSSLYNANIEKYHAEIVKDLKALQASNPKDYRPYWLLANHYGFADDAFSAIREFETVFIGNKDEKSAPGIVHDYLAACFYSFMFARCKTMIDDLVEGNNIKDPKKEFWMYAELLKQLREPALGQPIFKEDVFSPQRREFELGYISRLLGIWIPIKSEWVVAALDLTAAAGTHFSTVFPLKNAKKIELKSNISVTIQANPQKTFEEFIDVILKETTRKTEYTGWKSRWPATVYECWDSEVYKQNGGGHGFMVFVKRPQPTVKGVAIEAPAKFPSAETGGKVETIVLSSGYTRFNGDIYYAFILESAAEVFTQAKDEFFGFLERVLLD